MKNWKYIEGAKTGNETLAAHPDSAVAQEIYKIYLDNGKDENKALEVLASKYKNLPKEALKKHLKDAIKAYANIVRNSKAGNIAADITTDGNTWFVTTSDGKKKEFTSEREAEAYVKKIKTGNDTLVQYVTSKPKAVNEDKTGAEEFFKKLSDDVKEREDKDDEEIEKVGNFKTGKSALKPGDRVQSYGVQGTVRKVEGENSDNIYGEPIIEVEWDNGTVKKVGEHYLRKIGNKVGNSKWELPDGSTATVEDDGTIKIKKPRDSSIYITKLWDKERAEKQLAQKGAKKVGNARYTTREDVISHLDTDLYDICKKVPAGSPSFAYVSELQKKGWDISTISKYTKEIGKIIDQYKVGNKKLKFTDKQDGLKEFVYDEENDKGYIYYDGKLVDTIPHAGQGWLNIIKQKAFSSGVMNKTGNRVIEKENEMSQELKNLLKKAPEWIKEKIQYAFSHGFTIDEKDFINAIKKEVGNSKTGNAKDKNDKDLKIGDIVDVRGKKGKITKIIGDVIEVFYDNSGTYNPDRTDRHYADEATKVGNSAQDDKFAYVMREFDAGKLKTPDGKVVTDPAQAKAIAYSESKKTENGLARARKAIK